MKSKFFSLFLAVIILLSLAACTGAEPQSTATQPAPTQKPTPDYTIIPASKVVLKMVDRLNAGDVEGSLEYFADDAKVYFYGFPPTGLEIYSGKDQIRAVWEDSVNNHFEWEVTVTYVDGDIAYLDTKTSHDFTRQLGVAPLEYQDVYRVVNGRIVSYGSWMTKESLDRFLPAFAAAVPPEPTLEPISDPGVSEMTVTIDNATCSTDKVAALKAGEVKVNVNVKDRTYTQYAVSLFSLDSGKDILDLMIATYGSQPTWAHSLLMKEVSPGMSKTYTINVKEGPIYLVCWAQPPDLAIGTTGTILVVP